MCLVYTNCVHRCAPVQVVYSSTAVQYILQINLYIYKARACVCQVCELVITISKVNIDHIPNTGCGLCGVRKGIWYLLCAQANPKLQFQLGWVSFNFISPHPTHIHMLYKDGWDFVIFNRWIGCSSITVVWEVFKKKKKVWGTLVRGPHFWKIISKNSGAHLYILIYMKNNCMSNFRQFWQLLNPPSHAWNLQKLPFFT
jgi:hypothetical protein